MSIEVAIAWLRSKIRNPRAVADAVGFFEKADREVQRATLLLSDRLTSDRKGWLGRWTGHEFVAAELSPHHQSGLGIKAGAMCKEPEEFADGRPPHSQLLTLSGIAIDGAEGIVPDRPIIGRCAVGIDDVSQTRLRNCALRCEFYRPDLMRPVTGYCHLDEALRPEGHEVRFTFPAFQSAKNPWKVEATMVLFLQMMTADDVAPMTGIREISNTAIALVEFKQQANS